MIPPATWARGQELVNRARDVGNRRRPTGRLGRPLRKYGDDVRLPMRRIDNAGIVRDGRDVSRLVGHSHGRGQSGRYAAAELLRVEDPEHLARQLRSEGALLGDEPQQLNEPVGGHAIVDSRLERALVFDSAANVDSVDVQVVE